MSGEVPPVEVFRAGYMRANELFNAHDFDAAFAGLSDEVTWETVAQVPGPRVMHGRKAIVAAFRDLASVFPDWRVTPQEFQQAPNAIVVRNVASAHGAESGTPIEQSFSQVWEYRNGEVVRIREFLNHAQALEAAGLSE